MLLTKECVPLNNFDGEKSKYHSHHRNVYRFKNVSIVNFLSSDQKNHVSREKKGKSLVVFFFFKNVFNNKICHWLCNSVADFFSVFGLCLSFKPVWYLDLSGIHFLYIETLLHHFALCHAKEANKSEALLLHNVTSEWAEMDRFCKVVRWL